VVLRADAAEKNLGDRFALCASELKQRHRVTQDIPAGEANTLGGFQESARAAERCLRAPGKFFLSQYWTTELHVNLPSAAIL
jgi:hypothetical protein